MDKTFDDHQSDDLQEQQTDFLQNAMGEDDIEDDALDLDDGDSDDPEDEDENEIYGVDTDMFAYIEEAKDWSAM